MKVGFVGIAVAALCLALSSQQAARAQAFFAEASDAVSPQSEIVPLNTTDSVNLTFGAGWSMISLPVLTASSDSLKYLFPNAISAFRFAGAYQQMQRLSPCTGYWLNLPAGGGTYPITGAFTDSCSNTLPQGWSMVGTPHNGTPVASIVQTPANIILSVFGFSGSYTQVYPSTTGTPTVAQGQGYWVNLTGAGTLKMRAGGVGKALVGEPEADVISGSRLLVQANGFQVALPLGVPSGQLVELPPPPPAGLLDARVDVNGVSMNGVPATAQPAEYRLRVQGMDLVLGWDIASGESQDWQLEVDGQVYALAGFGGFSPERAPREVWLRYAPQARVFALQGNYPNPFNPSTTIRYSVAEERQVRLAVYNTIGQLVRTLVDQRQSPGGYTVLWDGRDDAGDLVANGLYFCEFHAGQFRSVRKLLMMK